MRIPQQKPQRSFAVNVAFSLLSLVIPLVFAFFATPYLIRGLGTEAYGYYSLVLAVIGFGFTTGVGKVTAKYIPENLDSNDGERLTRLLAATILITAAAALLEAVALAVATPFFVHAILNVPETAVSELRTAIYVACLIGPAMMLSQVFQSALQGTHRFRAFSLLTIIASLTLNLGSIILAVNGTRYSAIFLWNLTVTITGSAAFFLILRRTSPDIKFGFRTDWVTFIRVGRFVSSIFIYQSITSIFYLFERAFVLRHFGAETLTYFTVPLMLGIYLHGLVLSFSQVAVPRLNEKISQPAELGELYKVFTKIAVASAVFLALMYFCVGNQLLTLWLGVDFAGRSYSLLIIDGLAFAAIAISIVCWILAEAAHRSGINAVSSTVTSIIGIGSIVPFAAVFGINGVAAGRLIGAVAVLPIIFFVERIVFQKILWKLWLGIVARLATACLGTITVNYFIGTKLAISWPYFVFLGILLSFVFWAIVLLSGFLRRDEFSSAIPDYPKI